MVSASLLIRYTTVKINYNKGYGFKNSKLICVETEQNFSYIDKTSQKLVLKSKQHCIQKGIKNNRVWDILHRWNGPEMTAFLKCLKWKHTNIID